MKKLVYQIMELHTKNDAINQTAVILGNIVHFGVSQGVFGGFTLPKRILLGTIAEDKAGARAENEAEREGLRQRRSHMIYPGIGSTRLFSAETN